MTTGLAAADGASLDDGIGRYLVAGTVLGVLMVFGAGGWAATAELSGAVLASGTVVVDSKVKKVQHPTGGVVGEIRVKDGDKVDVGDVLVRLDDTVTRANLDTVTKQLDELYVREARLRAELAGGSDISWPAGIAGRAGEPALAAIMAAERALFESRTEARSGQRSQLNERIAQLRAQIEGLDGQAKAKAGESDLAGKELIRLQGLEAAKLVPETKMTDTRRELSRLKGDAAQLQSSLAEAKEKIAETQLQILQLDDDMRSEDGKDLRELQGKVAELVEHKVSAQDQLKRTEIRAPQAGIVHQLAVHTIGGVIAQGETVMEIVPGDDPLVIEARVSPSDIDHVRVSQAAFVRFPAFSQRTTPEFVGTISVISADLTRDTVPGSANPPYYLVRITLTPDAQEKLGALKLLPGMPAEVHIETPRRTALSYLVKPLADQIALAFKER
jgi:HlyD family secretion protein